MTWGTLGQTLQHNDIITTSKHLWRDTSYLGFSQRYLPQSWAQISAHSGLQHTTSPSVKGNNNNNNNSSNNNNNSSRLKRMLGWFGGSLMVLQALLWTDVLLSAVLSTGLWSMAECALGPPKVPKVLSLLRKCSLG